MDNNIPESSDNPENSQTIPQSMPIPSDGDSIVSILELLQNGSITEERGRLRWSSNYTFLVSVCDDQHKTLAIYKPRQGERPLWDFPDGTLCNRERAAFLISEAIGWRIVPPTVLREGSRGLGSFQFFIEHDPEINYFNLGKTFTPQLMRFTAFDYITNNADRKGGHCLLDVNHKIWGIDHGICFHSAHKLRTVIWDYAGEPVPDHILEDVKRFGDSREDDPLGVWKQLESLISRREMDALWIRIERLLTSAKFPQPGHGPSYPWPPV